MVMDGANPLRLANRLPRRSIHQLVHPLPNHQMTMNPHEIITILGIACPIAYGLGQFDAKRNADDITSCSNAFFVGLAACISAAVAITIRVIG